MAEHKRPPPLRGYVVGKTRVVWPLLAAEWCLEWVAYAVDRMAVFKVLGELGKLSILIAAVAYILGADERRAAADEARKDSHYQAWRVITQAFGQPGNGGRVDALQDLHRDSVSLAGVDVSGADLTGVQLQTADLRGARLIGTNLANASLAGADLSRAIMTDALLTETDLRGATLNGANLSRARIDGALLDSVTWDNATIVQSCMWLPFYSDTLALEFHNVDARGAHILVRAAHLRFVATWSDLSEIWLDMELQQFPETEQWWVTNVRGAHGVADLLHDSLEVVSVPSVEAWDSVRTWNRGFPYARQDQPKPDFSPPCPVKHSSGLRIDSTKNAP